MLTLQDILSSPKQLFSIKQVSQALGITRQTLDFHISKGSIDAIFIGKTRAITGKSVSDYIQKKHGGFRHISEILKEYKLPFERNGK